MHIDNESEHLKHKTSGPLENDHLLLKNFSTPIILMPKLHSNMYPYKNKSDVPIEIHFLEFHFY